MSFISNRDINWNSSSPVVFSTSNSEEEVISSETTFYPDIKRINEFKIKNLDLLNEICTYNIHFPVLKMFDALGSFSYDLIKDITKETTRENWHVTDKKIKKIFCEIALIRQPNNGLFMGHHRMMKQLQNQLFEYPPFVTTVMDAIKSLSKIQIKSTDKIAKLKDTLTLTLKHAGKLEKITTREGNKVNYLVKRNFFPFLNVEELGALNTPSLPLENAQNSKYWENVEKEFLSMIDFYKWFFTGKEPYRHFVEEMEKAIVDKDLYAVLRLLIDKEKPMTEATQKISSTNATDGFIFMHFFVRAQYAFSKIFHNEKKITQKYINILMLYYGYYLPTINNKKKHKQINTEEAENIKQFRKKIATFSNEVKAEISSGFNSIQEALKNSLERTRTLSKYDDYFHPLFACLITFERLCGNRLGPAHFSSWLDGIKDEFETASLVLHNQKKKLLKNLKKKSLDNLEAYTKVFKEETKEIFESLSIIYYILEIAEPTQKNANPAIDRMDNFFTFLDALKERKKEKLEETPEKTSHLDIPVDTNATTSSDNSAQITSDESSSLWDEAIGSMQNLKLNYNRKKKKTKRSNNRNQNENPLDINKTKNIPVYKIETLLKKQGYIKVRTKGSHATWEHPQSKLATTLAGSGSKVLKRKTLDSVLRQLKNTAKNFQ